MRLRISSSILGTNRLLVFDTIKQSFDLSSLSADWSYDCNDDLPRLDELLKVEGIKINTDPPIKFIRSLRSLASRDSKNMLWSLSMPQRQYMRWVTTMVKSLTSALDTIDTGYYLGPHRDSSRLTCGLTAAKVSKQQWQLEKIKHPTSAAVNSFIPDENGYARAIKYDRYRTRTGRLVVSEGPDILTLPRDSRSMIKSRYDNGNIVMFDYVSFEIQHILVAAGMKPIGDAYEYISHELYAGEISRSRIKNAMLSMGFGAGDRAVAKSLQLEGSSATAAVNDLRKFLNLTEFGNKLAAAVNDKKQLRNHYGRLVRTLDFSQGMLINTYIQSTAVDAALLGFLGVVEALPDDGHALFVIHDALILDCGPKTLAMLPELKECATQIKGFENKFPCQSKIIS